MQVTSRKANTMRFVMLYSAFPLVLLFLCCEGCLKEEREALLQIKSSINTQEGTAFSGWQGKDCCRWKEVECDGSTAHVVKMFFQYQRSSDRTKVWLPNATVFAQFKEIQEINLAGNNIGGFISPSALQQLKHLQKLDLRDNSIANSSAICWGSIPSLYHLDLSNNQLGEIPKCLCQGQQLTNLVLSQNKLSGNINTCLADMKSFQSLSLSNNLLTGQIPASFGNMEYLESLDLSHNHLSGQIPQHLTYLQNLALFNVSFNNLSGPIPLERQFATFDESSYLGNPQLCGAPLIRKCSIQQ